MLAIISYVLMQKIRSAGASIWMGVALFIAVLAKLLFDILLPRRLDGLSSMSYVACVAPLLLSLAIVTAILLRATRASVMGLRH